MFFALFVVCGCPVSMVIAVVVVVNTGTRLPIPGDLADMEPMVGRDSAFIASPEGLVYEGPRQGFRLGTAKFHEAGIAPWCTQKRAGPALKDVFSIVCHYRSTQFSHRKVPFQKEQTQSCIHC